jgi:galactokinase/mevalonate kinase-like predicted kinase
MYGGTVIACTLHERAEAIVSPSPRLIFDVYGQFQVLEHERDLEYSPELHFLDVAKAVWRYLRTSSFAEEGRIDPAATFHVRAGSSIPLQAGCAGSTAILMCILAAVLENFEIHLGRHALAELARAVERHELGVTCGYQDQYMIAFGGLNCIDLRDKENHGDGDQEPFATVEPLTSAVPRLPFVLGNTGVQRHSGQFHAAPRQAWEEGDPRRREGFARLGTLGRLGKRAMLDANWEWLGELMNENCAIVSDLIGLGEVNERLIGAAREAGALGAKLSGAGRGGTVIVLHEDPEWMGQRLLEAGAERLLRLDPGPGLEVRKI